MTSTNKCEHESIQRQLAPPGKPAGTIVVCSTCGAQFICEKDTIFDPVDDLEDYVKSIGTEVGSWDNLRGIWHPTETIRDWHGVIMNVDAIQGLVYPIAQIDLSEGEMGRHIRAKRALAWKRAESARKGNQK